MSKYEIMPELLPVQAIRGALPDGQEIIILRETEGAGSHEVIIAGEVFALLNYFDGKTPVNELKTMLLNEGMDVSELKVLDDLTEALDNGLIIKGEAYRIVESNFRREVDRFARHAGTAYPDNTGMCHRFIQNWYKESKMEVPRAMVAPPDGARLIGLVSPHYDLNGSGPTVATAFRALEADFKKNGEADTIVILGASHSPVENGIAITRKNYLLPIGEAPADVELIDAIAKALPVDPYAGEIAFRGEFVCEFQTLFVAWYRLKHPESKIKIVPLLISPLDADSEEDDAPPPNLDMKTHPSRAIIDSIASAVKSLGRRVVYIASADLAHVGKRFDTTQALTDDLSFDVEKSDLRALELLRVGNSQGLVHEVFDNGNPYGVCSTAVLYYLSELCAPGFHSSVILHYTQMQETETESMVAFAAQSVYESIKEETADDEG